MFKQLFAIVFVALISSSYSQYVSRGQCEDRNIKPVKNFPGVNRYGDDGILHRWYTVFTFNVKADCQEITFRRRSSLLTVSNFSLRQKDVSKDEWLPSSDGVITLASDNGEGIINVKYNNAASPLQFKILGYNNSLYTIDYNCVNINSNSRRETLYARGRPRFYEQRVANEVEKILKDNGLADIKRTYIYQDEDDCF
ncbi:uncharacterized protein LOC108740855 [Agrilus planipennis]|uniref:Uncharacterized protein LOC108740855 n=1 Tax=Agrilus planipennis TaxID=224129 RepID=A0A7F5RGP3_AGRPL|nr:uncharacterized protein LOC108740855 [Agrilus planipennis]